MLNPFAQKILIDAVSGTPSFSSLSVKDCFNLLGIYNRRYVGFLLEYGQSFDLYIADHHLAFNRIKSQFGYGEAEIHQIESKSIYASFCNFLFHEAVVNRNEIEAVLNLHEQGFFNFVPREDGLSLSDLFYEVHNDQILRKDIKGSYQRKEISNFPVLLTLPNKIHCNISAADRHFVEKTPQYARYVEAIKVAQTDAKKLKAMNEVYSSLIVIDECIDYFKQLLKPQYGAGFDQKIRYFLESIQEIDDKNDQLIISHTKVEHLQWSKVNQVLDWIFKTKSLTKPERQDLLNHLVNNLIDGEKSNNQILCRSIYKYIEG